MKTSLRILSVILLLICSLPALADVDVRIIKNGNSIDVGSRFTFEMKYSGTGQISYPNPPPGTRVVYTSMEQSTVNGVSGSRCSLTVLAVTPGTYSFQAQVGSRRSKIVKYTIGGSASGDHRQGGSSTSPDGGGRSQSAGQAPDNSGKPQFIGKGNENIFLRASVSKTSVYEQEALVYTIKLYTTFNYIKFLGAASSPKFEGFVVEEDKITDAQQTFETVNGRTYAAATVARYIIFPQKPGALKIIGNTYTVSADGFEYYNDPYFGHMSVKRPVQLNITPNDLVVNVRDLPSPRPANFSGGVGHFSLFARLPKQTYKTNQASRIEYVVRGTGNLKYLKLPELSKLYPASIEVFSPETKVEASVAGSNVSGTATFSYSFMPMETGKFNIPPVELVYFDPSSGRYETARCQDFTIDVARGSSSDKSQTARRFDSKLLPVASVSVPSAPWVRGFAYWLIFIIPGAGFVAAFFIYSSYRRSRADMQSFRSRKAGKIARRRLRRAAECLRRGDSDTFYDEVLSAIWGFLGDKLKMPTSGLTRRNISEVLVSHSISRQTVDDTIALLDDCEFAKYASATSSGDMKTVYDRAAALISDLDGGFSQNVILPDNDSDKNEDIF